MATHWWIEVGGILQAKGTVQAVVGRMTRAKADDAAACAAAATAAILGIHTDHCFIQRAGGRTVYRITERRPLTAAQVRKDLAVNIWRKGRKV